MVSVRALVMTWLVVLGTIATVDGPSPPRPGPPGTSKKTAMRGKDKTTGKPIKVTTVDEEVRKANWCVTGRDEPEMQYFPYSEFQPYLARTSSLRRRIRDDYGKAKFDYTLKLDEIKFTDLDEDIEKATGGIGRGVPDLTPQGKMLNAAHLKFNAYKLRAYPLGVKEVRKPTKIEGLVIQVNHSPLGIGTATAQFVDPELDIICSDCKHAQGRPVGCRKRTRNDIVPPTIMVFHHEMPVLGRTKDRRNPKRPPTQCKLCLETGVGMAGTTPVYPGPPTDLCRCTIFDYDPAPPTPPFDYKDCFAAPSTQDKIPECTVPCFCYDCLCNAYTGPGQAATPAVAAVPVGTGAATCPGGCPAGHAGAGSPEIAPGAPCPLGCPAIAQVAGTEPGPATCQCSKFQPDPSPMSFRKCEQPAAPVTPVPNPMSGLFPRVFTGTPLSCETEQGAAGSTCACTGLPKREPPKCCQEVTVDPGTIAQMTTPLPTGVTPLCYCRGNPGDPEGTAECDGVKAVTVARPVIPGVVPGAQITATCGVDQEPPPLPVTPTGGTGGGTGGGGPPVPIVPGPPAPPGPTIGTVCTCKPEVIPLDCSQDSTIAGCPDHEAYIAYQSFLTTKYLGRQEEVHGSLRWYYPPCLRSRAVEFQVLVIHSFAKRDFELIYFGPFEMPTLQAYPEMSQHVPTPFFHGYSKLYVCDDPQQATNILTDTDESARATYPFEYSFSYDTCIRNLSMAEKDGGQFCPKPDAYRCDKIEEAKYSVVRDRSCEQFCQDTTTIPPKNDTGSLFTRTPHGAINIITNFCIQPIAIFIGRYYKETLNRQSYKGMPLWYWMHLIGSGVASIAMYIGYFHPVWVPRSNGHVIAGNTIVITLALTYFSSWIRHKNRWLRMFAEFFHGGCGYVCSFIAYWCLHTAPNVSTSAKVLIYIATSVLFLAYFIMEVCIVFLDKKFGMKPNRRHFPTIEARFGDLPVPGAYGRIALLIFLFITMLILTSLTMIL